MALWRRAWFCPDNSKGTQGTLVNPDTRVMRASLDIPLKRDTLDRDIPGEAVRSDGLVREGWTNDRRRSCSREASRCRYPTDWAGECFVRGVRAMTRRRDGSR